LRCPSFSIGNDLRDIRLVLVFVVMQVQGWHVDISFDR
jgi:hypothetical protein